MAHIEREVTRFQTFLLQQGQKLTTGRSAVVREIFATHYHFDVDELFFSMRDKGVRISRATIYRSLELLVKSGMVRRLHLGEDHYHYEHVTGNSQHDHLICTICGDVTEFHDETLAKRQREICKRKRFMPTVHNLQILGLCESCQRKGQTPHAPDRVRMIQATRLRK